MMPMLVNANKRRHRDEVVDEFILCISSFQSSLCKYCDDMTELSDYLVQYRQDVDVFDLLQRRHGPLKLTQLFSLQDEIIAELERIAEGTGMLVT
jgi:hypothetical protein